MKLIMKKGIYFKQLIIYLILFLFVPTMVYTFFGYYNFSDILKTKLYESTSKRLELLQKDVGDIMKNATSDILTLAVDPKLQDIITLQNSQDHYNATYINKLIDFRYDTRELLTTKDFIHSIYLYNPTSNYIVTSSGQSILLDDFYDTNWKKSLQDIHELTLLPARRPLDANASYVDVDRDVLSRVITIAFPLHTLSKEVKGYIIVNLFEKKLIPQTDDLVFFLDENGSVIAGSATEPDYTVLLKDIHKKLLTMKFSDEEFTFVGQDDDYLVNYTFYHGKKRTLLIVTPITDVLSTLKRYQLAIIIVSSFLVLLGIIFSFIITHRLYSPIKTTLIQLGAENVDHELEYIKSVVHSIQRDNATLHHQLESQKYNSYESELLQIIKGDLPNNFFLNHCYKYHWVLLSMDQYEYLINKNNHNELFYIRQFLKKQVESDLKALGTCKGVLLERDKILFIIGLTIDEKNNDLPTHLTLTQKELIHQGYWVSFAYSSAIKELEELRSSYLDTLSAMDYRLSFGIGSLISSQHINPVQADSTTYLNDYNTIINQLRTGNFPQLQLYLARLFQHLKDDGHLSRDLLMTILAPLIAKTYNYMSEHLLTLSRIMDDQYPSLYKLIAEQETLKDVQNILEQVYASIITIQEKDHEQVDSVEQALHYIKENYNNHSLDLNLLSEEINMSYSYLRKQIKKYTGLTYIEYLNKYRIHIAKNLLHEDKLTIKEISYHVGYNNDQSFTRYFKKYEGVTPSDYRRYNQDK